MPQPVSQTPFKYIANKDDLIQLCNELRKCKEIAVDLEVNIMEKQLFVEHFSNLPNYNSSSTSISIIHIGHTWDSLV